MVSVTRGRFDGARRELAYFSGFARLMERNRGGAGVILKFSRVRPRSKKAFRPLKSHEIAPDLLDRLVGGLGRWNFDVVSLDQACARLAQPPSRRRFACLTFDGGYRDVLEHAYPILARHDVPFAVYLPTAFPDGLGQAWWLALETIIAKHDRIGLMMNHEERHFDARQNPEKHQLYDFLGEWLRTLSPPDLTAAINDLCSRYSVDLVKLSRENFMDWDSVMVLADDPRVTLGTATVSYPVLTSLNEATALREIGMGRAVAQATLGWDPLHLAYPFGEEGTFDRRHVAMAQEAGFRSAVTSVPGVVPAGEKANPHALPRIAWRRQSLRALRVMMSGVFLPR